MSFLRYQKLYFDSDVGFGNCSWRAVNFEILCSEEIKTNCFREPASCLASLTPWSDSLTDSRLELVTLNIQHVFVTRILLGRFPTSRQQATNTHTHTHTDCLPSFCEQTYCNKTLNSLTKIMHHVHRYSVRNCLDYTFSCQRQEQMYLLIHKRTDGQTHNEER
jgi:hypothetical protein